MNHLTLIWAALKRRKGRTIFTWLSVLVAFLLFSILAAVRYGSLGTLEMASAQRLDTDNRVSRGAPMPLSYYAKIITVPGVTAVAYLKLLQGQYKDPQNTFQVLFTNASGVLHVFPEFKLPAAQVQAWLADRKGAIAGPALARRMGWKVGETIPVQSTVPLDDGGTTWYFHLDGIYATTLPTYYQNFFVGHYQYFNEGVASPELRDTVFKYLERIDDPRNATRISDAIDALFANSTPQTLTQPQTQEILSFIRQFGNVAAIALYVGIAVFATLLLIVGITIAQSVRERVAEFAMFRALGFSRRWILWLILEEALLLMLSGAIAGMVLGWLLTRALYPIVGNILATFQMTWDAAGVGIVIAIAFAVLTALLPQRVIHRLHVAEALRQP